MATDQSGQEFEGDARFRVLGFLGRGGMGAVYRVFDRELGNVVALKTIRVPTAEAIYRLKREFRSLAGISHRNLVRLYDLVVRQDACFFTMEYVPGSDFLEYVRRGPGGDPPEARLRRLRQVLPQLVRGLAFLHDCGRLHRDVKPSNVRVDPAGRVALLDFDLALVLAEGGAAPETAGEAAGTLAYMAPEQLWGLEIGPPADWFAVGVMLHEALTGWHPFGGRAPPLPDEGRSADLSRLFAGTAPAPLAEAVARLLDPDPARRPGGELLLEILDALTDVHELASPRRLAERRVDFVGRERERGVLRDVVRSRGALRVIGLCGASGIGKSELVRRVLAEIEEEAPEVVVLAGRCHPQESVPFKAFDPIVDALSRHLLAVPEASRAAFLPPDAGAAARLFPVLGRVPGIEPPPPDAPTDVVELRRRAVAALRELFQRLVAAGPVVLWIDDAHWSDQDSGELLEELLEPGASPSLCLLLTYRDDPEEKSPLLRVLHRRAEEFAGVHLEEIALGPLGPAEARELARRLGATSQVPDEALDSILEEAAGSPFLLGALLWPGRDRQPGVDGLARPPGVGDAIARRVETLPARERRLLELVSLCGRPTERRLLLEAARLGERGRPLVQDLEDLGFVRTLPATGGRRAVETYHDRIRERVVEALAPEERAARHRALATTFEESARVPPDLLAHHFHGAGEPGRASEYAVRAAEAAEGALAFVRAAELYRAAREWDPRGPVHERALRAREADATVKAGRLVEGGRLFLGAAEGAEGHEALELRRRAAEHLFAGGALDEGLAILGALLAELDLPDPRTPARAAVAALARLCRVGARRLDPGGAARAPDPRAHLRIDTSYGASKNLVNADPVRGIYFGLVALDHALRARDPLRLGQVLCVVGGSIAVAGGPLALLGRRMMRAAEGIAARLDAPELWGTLEVARGRVLMLEGRPLEAVAHSSAGVERLARSCPGYAFECNIGRGTVLRALEDLGRLEELELRARELRDAALAAGNTYAEATAAIALGVVHLMDDDPAGARELARHSLRLWTRRGFHIQHLYAIRVEVLGDLYEGRPEAGWARLEAIGPDLRASGLLRVPLVCVDVLALQGRLALALAAAGGAVAPTWRARARRAVRGLRRLHRRDAQMHAALLGAGLHVLAGECAPARRALERAISRSDEGGFRVHVDCARLRRAELAGDRDAVERADRALRACGVARPVRLAGVVAPGFASGPEEPGGEGQVRLGA